MNSQLKRFFFLFTMSFSFLLFLYYLTSIRGPKSSGAGGMPRDIFSFGKSNVKVLGVDINVKVRFKDVAGLKEVKLLDTF